MKHGPRHTMLFKRVQGREHAHELVGFIPGRMESDAKERDRTPIVLACLSAVALVAFVLALLNGWNLTR